MSEEAASNHDRDNVLTAVAKALADGHRDSLETRAVALMIHMDILTVREASCRYEIPASTLYRAKLEIADSILRECRALSLTNEINGSSDIFDALKEAFPMLLDSDIQSGLNVLESRLEFQMMADFERCNVAMRDFANREGLEQTRSEKSIINEVLGAMRGRSDGLKSRIAALLIKHNAIDVSTAISQFGVSKTAVYQKKAA